MRPVLLDTNAYTAFKLGEPGMVELLQRTETIGISPIVIGELLGGFEYGNKAQKNRAELAVFLNSARVKNYPLTADTAHFYSNIYALLRKKGQPIPSNDLWIAAQALEHGCVVCTFDKHFKAIENLVSGTSITELLF